MNALLAQKVGMTQIFDGDSAVPVTVLRAGPCRISQVKTAEKDGYSAIQITYGELAPGKVNKPQAGHFDKAKITPARHTVEVKVDEGTEFTAGQEFRASDVFAKGMLADVAGVTKGKGFTGHMKRHNFKGQLASHGVHRVHRAPGSIGACATPSRVFKGMPMAGRMGGERQTTLSLEVIEVDEERGLVLVKGAVPGVKGSLVFLRHAVKWDGDPAALLEEARVAREAAAALPNEAAEEAAETEEPTVAADETASDEAPAEEPAQSEASAEPDEQTGDGADEEEAEDG